MRPTRIGARELTPEQLQELCTPMVILITGQSAFADEASRKAAWFEHRDRVLRRYHQTYPHGHSSSVGAMPAAFWAYEAPLPERKGYPQVRR